MQPQAQQKQPPQVVSQKFFNLAMGLQNLKQTHPQHQQQQISIEQQDLMEKGMLAPPSPLPHMIQTHNPAAGSMPSTIQMTIPSQLNSDSDNDLRRRTQYMNFLMSRSNDQTFSSNPAGWDTVPHIMSNPENLTVMGQDLMTGTVNFDRTQHVQGIPFDQALYQSNDGGGSTNQKGETAYTFANTTQNKMFSPYELLHTSGAGHQLNTQNNDSIRSSFGNHEDEVRTDMFVWGSDKQGQLGQNHSKKIFTLPKKCVFPGLSKVRKVSCGDQHTAILTMDGVVHMMGSNQGGKLGIRNLNFNETVKAPKPIEDFSQNHTSLNSSVPDTSNSQRPVRMMDVCCANSFTLAVDFNGVAYSWGTNLYGALGLGRDITVAGTPTVIAQFAQNQIQICRISGKYNHSLFLDSSGRVFVSGKGDKGQIGLNQPTSKIDQNSNPNQSSYNSSLPALAHGLDSDSNLYTPSLNQNFAGPIIDVQAGKDFSLFLSHKFEVLACGANGQGQLGLGDTQEFHSQPTKLPNLEKVKKIQCNEGCLALTSAGELYQWGPISKDKSMIVPSKISGISDRVIDCSIGKFSFSAIDEKYMVWIWGENKHSQLGLGDYTPRQTPYPLLTLKEKEVDSVSFGQNFAIALSRTPKLKHADSVAQMLDLVQRNTTMQSQQQHFGSQMQNMSRLQQSPIFNQAEGNVAPQFMFKNYSQNHISHEDEISSHKVGAYSKTDSLPMLLQSPNFARHQSQIIDANLDQENPFLASQAEEQQRDPHLSTSCYNSGQTTGKSFRAASGQGPRPATKQMRQIAFNTQDQRTTQMEECQNLTTENHQTSYMTPSNYVIPQYPGESSAFQSNLSQQQLQQQFATGGMFSYPNFAQESNSQSNSQFKQLKGGKMVEGLVDDSAEDASRSYRTQNEDDSKSKSQGQKMGPTQLMSQGSSSVQKTINGGITSISNTVSQRSFGGKGAQGRNEVRSQLDTGINAEEYEQQLAQLDQLVKDYEKEMNELRASNQEQSSDLHTMIQTVNELKEDLQNTKQLLEEKETALTDLQKDHDEAMKESREKNQAQINKLISQIDFLSRKISDMEEQAEGPKAVYLKEIEDKTREIGDLNTAISDKQKEVAAMNTEIERFKLQVNNLNNKISDQQLQISELKEVQGDAALQKENSKLTQSLDIQKNMNKCHQLTIEKLENKIVILESEKNDEQKNESKVAIEKAQLMRKITALENQLRFQTNVNEENKREIQKMDKEITEVAENSAAREAILNKKLEDSFDTLRKERIAAANLKQEIMQRENHIEQLKASLRQQAAETKLARLENEALVKQTDYEKNYMGQLQLKNHATPQPAQKEKSPIATRAQRSGGRFPTQKSQKHSQHQQQYQQQLANSDSYVDMSYSQSPSLVLKNQKQASIERNYMRENNKDNGGYVMPSTNKPADPALEEKQPISYNEKVLRNIENKMIKSLYDDFQKEDQIEQYKRSKSNDQTAAVNRGRTSHDGREQSAGESLARKVAEQASNQSEGGGTVRPRDASRKMYNQAVQNSVNNLLGLSQKKSDGSQRGRSLGPGLSGLDSDRAEKKEPTYIQKLMGLNRTHSQSSSQYAYNVPPWQKLLKARQTAQAAPQAPVTDQGSLRKNSQPRRDRNTGKHFESTVSMGDIPESKYGQHSRNEAAKSHTRDSGTSYNGFQSMRGGHESLGESTQKIHNTIETRHSVKHQGNITLN